MVSICLGIGGAVVGLALIGWFLFAQVGSPTGEIAELKKLGELGDTDAQVKLGEYYRDGMSPVSKDPVEAMYWFTKAARNGHMLAQVEVGFGYAMGIGVTKNREKALEWCEKAGHQGHTATQTALGSIYSGNDGFPEDPKKSFYWTEMAALGGSAEAQFQCAVNHLSGYGTEKNEAKFFQWLDKSVEQEFEPAIELKNQMAAKMEEERRVRESIAEHWRIIQQQTPPTSGVSPFGSPGPTQYVPPAFRDAQRRAEQSGF